MVKMPHVIRTIEAQCERCKEPFQRKLFGGGLYTRYCYVCLQYVRMETARNLARSGPENNRWIGGKTSWVCEECGKNFEAYGNERKFCSWDCANKHHGLELAVDMRSRLRFENDLCAYLEAKGYMCMRSAGSRGAADVFAINHSHMRMIQLKTTISLDRKGNTSIFADAIEKLRELPCPPNTTQELWVKPLRKNWLYIVVSDLEAKTREEVKRYLKSPEWIEG